MVDFWPDSLNCQILQQEISNVYNNKRILLCDEIRLSYSKNKIINGNIPITIKSKTGVISILIIISLF